LAGIYNILRKNCSSGFRKALLVFPREPRSNQKKEPADVECIFT